MTRHPLLKRQARAAIERHRHNGESMVELAELLDDLTSADRRIHTSPKSLVGQLRALDGIRFEHVDRSEGWERRRTGGVRILLV